MNSHHRTLLAAQTVLQGRFAAEKILRGDDDRLLVVVGLVFANLMVISDFLTIRQPLLCA